MDKNPISALQEYMVFNRNLVPKYITLMEKSGSHINEFEIKVICDDLSATGVGSSKKQAKFRAATELLKLLERKSMSTSTEFDVINNCSDSSDYNKDTTLGTTIALNYVGKLQEYAQARGVIPIYDYTQVTGFSHDPKFTCVCKYKELTEEAEGNSKKNSKQLAAKKMYFKVMSPPEDLLLDILSIKSKYNE